jgi:hypothetical protein
MSLLPLRHLAALRPHLLLRQPQPHLLLPLHLLLALALLPRWPTPLLAPSTFFAHSSHRS